MGPGTPSTYWLFQQVPRDWRSRRSLQLAFSSLSLLQLAFFVVPPTTPNFLTALSLSHREISVATISSDEGSDTSTNSSDGGLMHKEWWKGRISRIVSGFLTIVFMRFHYLSHWLLSQCIGLALENWWKHKSRSYDMPPWFCQHMPNNSRSNGLELYKPPSWSTSTWTQGLKICMEDCLWARTLYGDLNPHRQWPIQILIPVFRYFFLDTCILTWSIEIKSIERNFLDKCQWQNWTLALRMQFYIS